MGNGVALRYGVGVGRDGFQWGGIQKITLKREWPGLGATAGDDRTPALSARRWMAGGPGNPLGARAMNLGATVYRIHGTNAPETIGQAVSSGCFRLVNDDVADLYSRVQLGTKVRSAASVALPKKHHGIFGETAASGLSVFIGPDMWLMSREVPESGHLLLHRTCPLWE